MIVLLKMSLSLHSKLKPKEAICIEYKWWWGLKEQHIFYETSLKLHKQFQLNMNRNVSGEQVDSKCYKKSMGHYPVLITWQIQSVKAFYYLLD